MEKKAKGAGKKGADQKEKADREALVKPANETQPPAIDPAEGDDTKRAAKQKAKAEKKPAEDDAAGKGDPAK